MNCMHRGVLFSFPLIPLKMFCYKILSVLISLSCVVKYTECSLILEDGYTVETVFDGNKVDVYPYAILPAEKDIILLDSVSSTLFRIGLPLLEGKLVELFAGSGHGVAGFVDGDLTKAKFKHPKAFTVDAKGNIYVADRENFAVRKISKSGVSTIAGGMVSKHGNADGPSQNATFSSDFDLTFVPSICSLLVSDRGNRMIRQIKLPSGECTYHSGLGTHWVITLAACFASFLLGLLVMFFLQAYIIARAGPGFQRQKQIHNFCLTSVVKQFPMSFSIILSVVVRNFVRPMTTVVHLMFNAVFIQRTVKYKPQECYKKSVSLLDADIASEKLPSEMKVSSNPSENLISFDPFFEASVHGIFDTSEEKNAAENTIPKPIPERLDDLMHVNILAFKSEASFTGKASMNELKSKQEAWRAKGQVFKQE